MPAGAPAVESGLSKNEKSGTSEFPKIRGTYFGVLMIRLYYLKYYINIRVPYIFENSHLFIALLLACY